MLTGEGRALASFWLDAEKGASFGWWPDSFRSGSSWRAPVTERKSSNGSQDGRRWRSREEEKVISDIS